MKSILITILFAVSASSFAQTLSDRITAARVQPTVEQVLIADLWASLQDAQSQLSAMQATLAAAQASLAGTQQQVAADALVIASLNSTITSLNAKVAALQAQLAVACPVCQACTVCPVCTVCVPPPVVLPPTGTTTAILTWDAVTTASGYRVYYGSASGTYLQAFGSGIAVSTTTFTVNNLTTGRWFFAVTARDIQGNESAFSNEVFKDIGSPAPAPTPTPAPTESPSGTQLTLAGVGSITDHVGAVWTLGPKNVAVEGGTQFVVFRNKIIMGAGMSICYSGGIVNVRNDPGATWFKWIDSSSSFALTSRPAGCI